MVQQRERTAVERLVGDDLVSSLQQRPEHRGERSHARRRRHGGLASFKGSHSFFQHRDGRIADATIDVAVSRPRETVASGLGALKCIGRGEEHRWIERTMIIERVIALMDGSGGESCFGIFHAVSIIHPHVRTCQICEVEIEFLAEFLANLGFHGRSCQFCKF